MPKATELGVPYVSTRDFRGQDEIDYAGAKRISEEDYSALGRKIRPELGDILLSRYGTVGEVRLIRVDRPFQASYSIAIVKTVDRSRLSDYLVLALRCLSVQQQIRLHARATAQPDLGLEHIRGLAIPLPPEAEQERILSEVERRLSVVEGIEAAVAANLKRADRLRQSILKRAFEGKLVPQDPDDEPASVLLERIKAGRTSTTINEERGSGRRGRGTRRAAQPALELD